MNWYHLLFHFPPKSQARSHIFTNLDYRLIDSKSYFSQRQNILTTSDPVQEAKRQGTSSTLPPFQNIWAWPLYYHNPHTAIIHISFSFTDISPGIFIWSNSIQPHFFGLPFLFSHNYSTSIFAKLIHKWHQPQTTFYVLITWFT